MASFLVSGIGLVLLVYGRRFARLPQLVVGLLLCVFPYFVNSTGLTLGIGAGLLLALGVAVRLGW
jgi:hypothetical protein